MTTLLLHPLRMPMLLCIRCVLARHPTQMTPVPRPCPAMCRHPRNKTIVPTKPRAATLPFARPGPCISAICASCLTTTCTGSPLSLHAHAMQHPPPTHTPPCKHSVRIRVLVVRAAQRLILHTRACTVHTPTPSLLVCPSTPTSCLLLLFKVLLVAVMASGAETWSSVRH